MYGKMYMGVKGMFEGSFLGTTIINVFLHIFLDFHKPNLYLKYALKREYKLQCHTCD